MTEYSLLMKRNYNDNDCNYNDNDDFYKEDKRVNNNMS